MPRLKNIIVIVWLVLLLMFSGYGCSKNPAKKPQPPKKEAVGVSLADLKSANASAIKEALEKKKENNIKFIFKDAKNDAAQQAMDVQDLIDQKIKILLIEFVDTQSAMDLVQNLKGKGIKILALNVLPESVPVDGYIGPDYVRVGQLQGQFILNNMGRLKSDLCIALLEKDSPTSQPILDGEAKALADKVKLQKADIAADDPTSTASNIVDATQPVGKIGAVMTSSPLLTKALLENAIDPTAITLGTGITKETAEAIKMGVHDGDVDLMPELVGNHASIAVADLLKVDVWHSETIVTSGDYEIPAVIVPVRLITKDNLFLLEQRLKKIEAKPNKESDSGGSQGQSENQSGSGSGSSQGQGKGSGGGTKLIIETTDGKKMELQIDGEIKSVQMQKGQSGEQQGGQGQNQGGGQQ